MGAENVAEWPYGGQVRRLSFCSNAEVRVPNASSSTAQLFIDYADLFENLPRHLQASSRGDTAAGRLADRLLERDLPALLRELPTLYTKRGRTPTTKQQVGRSATLHQRSLSDDAWLPSTSQVCIAEMMSRLNMLATSVSLIRGRDYSSTVQLAHLQGADRLAYVVRGSADAFASALRTACEA